MCLFCQIAKHKQGADIVYEDDKLMAFNDIAPKAPIHLLVIPKKHIESINHLEEKNKSLIGEMVFLARKLAEKKDIANSGYKLVFHVGRGGGQEIDHIHLHLMGGWT